MISDIADDVLVYVPDCPTLLAREYAEKALAKLGEDIGLDTQIRKLKTLAGRRTYPLDALEGRKLVGVVGVRLDGQKVPWTVSGDTIRLSECPDRTGVALEIDISLTPDGDKSDTAAHQEAVRDYALHRLLLIPQQRWTDYNLAMSYLTSYKLLKNRLAQDKAADEQRRNPQPIAMRAAYKWV